ncbi:lasso RiPP family leader peptide-containing protein [Granulicella arctica]|uniref:Uncharacterized protein n=1 Tax=Granulicella arctica TaxID=940613 RepID=A0A7Y9PFX6_9BACT|nr:lasso RiPP family leader peptide-containing protein [Granulicella arctica]NYF78408.1 hypothetical protein [Granulicella arctica]
MSKQTVTNAKVTYTKPTLTEYGSLAERTKIFGLMNPDELDPSIVLILTPSIAVAVIG